MAERERGWRCPKSELLQRQVSSKGKDLKDRGLERRGIFRAKAPFSPLRNSVSECNPFLPSFLLFVHKTAAAAIARSTWSNTLRTFWPAGVAGTPRAIKEALGE